MKKSGLLAFTGILAAVTVLFTAYIFHIPIGTTGGYIHFGDAIIYLSAVLLPTPYAMAVGALGGGIADLLTAPMWVLPTVIIKMLIVLPFSGRKLKMLSGRNIMAPIISFLISATGYYIAGSVMFGSETALVASLAGSVVQSGGSALFFYIAVIALENAGVKKTFFRFINE